MGLINKTHMVCYGCTRRGVSWTATGYKCPVYANPAEVSMINVGECFFNKKVKQVEKKRVRIGQQKTKRSRG